jgi:hypothetical protein
LVAVQQLGGALIQANADGEPETVLQWLKQVVDRSQMVTNRLKYS